MLRACVRIGTRIFERRLALDNGVFLRGKIRISANTLAVEAQRGIVCRVCGQSQRSSRVELRQTRDQL